MLRTTNLLLLLLVSGACSTIGADRLTPAVVALQRGHAGIARVTAVGAGPITDEALTEAITTTIEISGLFDGVAPADDAATPQDWRLTARVSEVHEPEWSLVMTARVTIDWTLRDRAGELVWSESISTKSRSTPEETENVEERGAAALGGAVRDNLKRAVERMAALEPATGR